MLSVAMLLLAADDANGGPLSLLPMLIVFGFTGYLIVVRPMLKEKREQQALLSNLRKNDTVETTGGLVGVIAAIKDDEVVLIIDPKNNTRVRLMKSHIVRARKEPEVEKEATKEGGA
jgi:preprotein translocase subunit YajC